MRNSRVTPTHDRVSCGENKKEATYRNVQQQKATAGQRQQHFNNNSKNCNQHVMFAGKGNAQYNQYKRLMHVGNAHTHNLKWISHGRAEQNS